MSRLTLCAVAVAPGANDGERVTASRCEDNGKVVGCVFGSVGANSVINPLMKISNWHTEHPRVRSTTQYGLDAAAWAISLWVAQVLRFEYEFGQISRRSTAAVRALVAFAMWCP